MKKLSKLNLSQLANNELEKREMNSLKGGSNCCICGCGGPSSSSDNGNANNAGGSSGLISTGGGWGSGSFG